MIQIRHVPDGVHRKLKSKAALEGLSLSEYLLREVRAIAERPSAAELQVRLESRSSVTTRQSMAKAVRAERNAR
jgi:plasmid stability protein